MPNLYKHIHSGVYRLKDAIQRTGAYRILGDLQKEQHLKLDQIELLQRERLQRLLQKASRHSPYYNELFKKLGIDTTAKFNLNQLSEIPVLSRELLQENLKRILCDDALDPIPNSSGGSTGNPVNFYQDGYYVSYARAANLLFTQWMGINSGDRTAVFWGADRDFKDHSMRDKAWRRFDRVMALNSFSMNEDIIAAFLGQLNEFKPRYIQGYAGSLYLISKFINTACPIKFTPIAIRSSAEMLYDFQREEIEKAFKVKVYNFYGSREVNNLATECAAHEGLHVFSSGRIIEIVDNAGRPVSDGALGQIAVTDLTNLAFPFIRYINGDMAVKSPKPCSCGRGYPLLEKIQGRTTDMIIIDGQYIHGEYFTHLFYQRPDIKQFQVIQEKDGHLRILVVRNIENAKINDIVIKIREKIGSKTNISVEYTESIPATSTGKYRFTISRIGNSGKLPGNEIE